MDLGDDIQKLCRLTFLGGNLGLRLLWHILHLIVNIWYFALSVAHGFESFIISHGLLKRYKTLDISKVQYLAVVLDSTEARDTSKVLELLQWFEAIGVKNICLYDSEGVLKRSREAIIGSLNNKRLTKEASSGHSFLGPKLLNLEFLSFVDGKEGVANAANLLFVKHYLRANHEKPDLTESQMAEALGATGCGGAEPDLLLVYGPARCHLGFPAWRIRYTEIVHMGTLKSIKFGYLIKTIQKFTMVHQNYGT